MQNDFQMNVSSYIPKKQMFLHLVLRVLVIQAYVYCKFDFCRENGNCTSRPRRTGLFGTCVQSADFHVARSFCQFADVCHREIRTFQNYDSIWTQKIRSDADYGNSFENRF